MNESNSHDLQEKRDALARAMEAADTSKAALLEVVAQGLPDAVDAIGKARAHAEPGIARRLSEAGELEVLRADLRRIAAELGDFTRASIDRLDWPTESNSTYVQARVREVVRGIFLTEVMRPVERRLRGAGFKDALIYPNQLVQDQGYSAEVAQVASDLVQLREASNALRAAIAAQDKDFVEDVWK